MIIAEELIQLIKADSVNGVLEFCNIARYALDRIKTAGRQSDDYEEILEIHAFLESLSDSEILEFEIDVPPIVGKPISDRNAVEDVVNKIFAGYKSRSNDLKRLSLKSRFDMELSNKFSYEFSQGDIDKIQRLINELQEHISKSEIFELNHKSRLLHRLETLQADMHKKMTDVDMFWGLIGDAGVAIGKYGSDADPIVEKIRKIAEMVWNTQARAEELPSGTKVPLLAPFE